MNEALEPKGEEGVMIAPFASIYIERATTELVLRDQVPPITPDEFNLMYGLLRVAIRRSKDSNRAKKRLARHLLHVYIDARLIPLLGINSTASDIASCLKFELGKYFVMLPIPRVSEERKRHLDKLCQKVATSIADMVVVVTCAQTLPSEDLVTLFDNTCRHLESRAGLEDSVRELAIQLLARDFADLTQ